MTDSQTSAVCNERPSARSADSATTPQNPPGAATVPPEKQKGTRPLEYIGEERREASLVAYFEVLPEASRQQIEAISLDMWPGTLLP